MVALSVNAKDFVFFLFPFFWGGFWFWGGIPSFSFGSSQSDVSWGMACSCCSDSTWLVVVPWRFSYKTASASGKTNRCNGGCCRWEPQTVAVKSSNKLQSNRREPGISIKQMQNLTSPNSLEIKKWTFLGNHFMYYPKVKKLGFG